MLSRVAARPFAVALAAGIFLNVAYADSRILTIERGDTLSVLAQRYGVTVDELKQWNNLDNDRILIGQELVVHDPTSHVSAAPARTMLDDAGIDWSVPASLSNRNDELDWTVPFEFEEPPTEAIAAINMVPSKPSPEPAPETVPSEKLQTYTIQRGDTLTRIATRFGTDVRKLVALNPDVDPALIFPGRKLIIGKPRPIVYHIVERGETLEQIAARNELEVEQIERWNPDLRKRPASTGTSLKLFTYYASSASESLGAAYDGRLRNPARLKPHRAYFIRNPDRAWGTVETVRWLREGFDTVSKKFRANKRVRIHDLSDRDGGRLSDHRSHQTGRDVDITYYQNNCGNEPCPFRRVRASQVDVARQWVLLRHWLRRGQAEMILIDYKLQKPLYRQARRTGATRSELARWFQYPRGSKSTGGIIRHFPRHADHLHVRFVCPLSDAKCR